MTEAEVIWKPWPQCDSYEVSSAGEVRSWRRGRSDERAHAPRMLAPQSMRGYKRVHLGGFGTKSVHRLVLETFVGPRPIGLECRHLNGLRSDNRLQNLAWGTRRENTEDQRQHGTLAVGSRHGLAKLIEGNVILVKMLLSLPDADRPSQGEIGSAFSIDQTVVSDIKLGVIWKHVA